MASASIPMLHARIADYYDAKVRRHGATARGVDWPCTLTQELRFVQLLRVCDWSEAFSLNDVGCGWGALAGFIPRRHPGAHVDYLGVDLAAAMIETARMSRRRALGATFELGTKPSRVADYSVASGLFNVRINEPPRLWEQFIRNTLADLAETSGRGFAVNFLAALPAGMAGRPELYRTRPERWVRVVEAELGLAVTVLGAYGMREFTLIARPRR